MTTIGVLFGGFEGVAVGAKAAGIDLDWSIENDAAIAEVATANLGHRVSVRNILDCDPTEFDRVDIMHASPPCTNASVANASGGETDLDRRLACKVAAFVTELSPRIFTLENVWAYRNFDSWKFIEEALHRAGYWVSVEHVNSADYGVPQTRKRMIVRAIRGGFVPYPPEPVAWVGWYAAIEDLLPTLPESQFAPWQMARLPELLASTLVGVNGYEGKIAMAQEPEPSMTITANHNQIQLKAFLMAGGGNTNFEDAQPGKGCRHADEPAHTVIPATADGGTMPKAFLMQVQGQGGDGVLYEDEPMQTVTSNHGAAKYRAWLVNESSTVEVREANEPSATQVASQRNASQRALLSSGRVVAMTPRALARFQSFPDTYQLPDNARLAAKGIGNACPPLLMQGIYEQLLGSL